MPSSHVETVYNKRLLFIYDIKGALSKINELVAEHRCDAVVHCGSFGFFDTDSINQISDYDLKYFVKRSALVDGKKKASFKSGTSSRPGGSFGGTLRELIISNQTMLSELPLFLSEVLKFDVPVYTSYGDLEDVNVVQKFLKSEYKVNNLHIVAGSISPKVLDTDFRLFALPGLLNASNFFDKGSGNECAGNSSRCWTGIWQLGELLNELNRNFSLQDTNVLLYNCFGQDTLILNLVVSMFPFAFSVGTAKHRDYTLISNDGLEKRNQKLFVSELCTELPEFFKPIWEAVEPELAADSSSTADFSHSVANLLLNPPVKKLQDVVPFRSHQCIHLYMGDAISSGVVLTSSYTVSNVGIETFSTGPRFWKPIDKRKLFVQKRREDEKAAKPKSPTEGAIGATEGDSKEPSKDAAEEEPLRASSEAERASSDSESEMKIQTAGENEQQNESVKYNPHEDPSTNKKLEKLLKKKEKLKLKRKESKKALKDAKIKQLEERNSTTNSNNVNSGDQFTEVKRKTREFKPKLKETDMRKDEKSNQPRQALWFKNGERSAQQILDFLAAEDRELDPVVEIKDSRKPDGSLTKVALVVFKSPEQALHAYERVDKENAGTVTLSTVEKPGKFKRRN